MSDRRRSPVEPESIEPHMCSLDLRLEIIGKLPFFDGLPPGEIERINQSFREIGYQPGETIFFAGDPAVRLYVVASGKVKLMRHTFAGQDILVDILTPGDPFGSLSTLGDETYPNTAQAQTVVCALAINAEDFRRILTTYPTVALKVLDMTGARLNEAQEMVRRLSAHSVEQRVAYTLLKLAEKLGEPQDVGLLIQMPLSREDLAGMTGTTTATASRVISQLQRDGLINSGRQWVAITDAEALRGIAEGEGAR